MKSELLDMKKQRVKMLNKMRSEASKTIYYCIIRRAVSMWEYWPDHRKNVPHNVQLYFMTVPRVSISKEKVRKEKEKVAPSGFEPGTACSSDHHPNHSATEVQTLVLSECGLAHTLLNVLRT